MRGRARMRPWPGPHATRARAPDQSHRPRTLDTFPVIGARTIERHARMHPCALRGRARSGRLGAQVSVSVILSSLCPWPGRAYPPSASARRVHVHHQPASAATLLVHRFSARRNLAGAGGAGAQDAPVPDSGGWAGPG